MFIETQLKCFGNLQRWPCQAIVSTTRLLPVMHIRLYNKHHRFKMQICMGAKNVTVRLWSPQLTGCVTLLISLYQMFASHEQPYNRHVIITLSPDSSTFKHWILIWRGSSIWLIQLMVTCLPGTFRLVIRMFSWFYFLHISALRVLAINAVLVHSHSVYRVTPHTYFAIIMILDDSTI